MPDPATSGVGRRSRDEGAPPVSSHAIDAAADAALAQFLAGLTHRGYRFVTPTPDTHARVVARVSRQEARSLTDIFGWSLPFAPELLPDDLRTPLVAAGMLDITQPLHRSRIRVSTVRDRWYLHSAFPTISADAVFLGPDSYRFADLIAAELTQHCPPGVRIIDVGTGAGVGALTAAACCPDASVTMTDINPHALRLARINAAVAGVAATTLEASAFDGVDGMFDIILMNPPFIIDEHGPTYRHGGGMHGGGLSLDLARAALPQLAPGGRLILYTGSAIVHGGDALHDALCVAAAEQSCALRYRELDPDVFGEELSKPSYAEVDRIAIVAALFSRPSGSAPPDASPRDRP